MYIWIRDDFLPWTRIFQLELTCSGVLYAGKSNLPISCPSTSTFGRLGRAGGAISWLLSRRPLSVSIWWILSNVTCGARPLLGLLEDSTRRSYTRTRFCKSDNNSPLSKLKYCDLPSDSDVKPMVSFCRNNKAWPEWRAMAKFDENEAQAQVIEIICNMNTSVNVETKKFMIELIVKRSNFLSSRK